jgi:hypothetical protein
VKIFFRAIVALIAIGIFILTTQISLQKSAGASHQTRFWSDIIVGIAWERKFIYKALIGQGMLHITYIDLPARKTLLAA